jgi:hypothetical protein
MTGSLDTATYLAASRIGNVNRVDRALEAVDLGPDFALELHRRGATTVITTCGDASLRRDDGIISVPTLAGALVEHAPLDLIFVNMGSQDRAAWSTILQSIGTAAAPKASIYIEFPIGGNMFESRWISQVGAIGLDVVPSFRYIQENLLNGLASRDVAWFNTTQRAQRSTLFECRKLQPSVLLLGGPSRSGKTTLSRLFSKQGCSVLNFDFILSEWLYLGRSAAPEHALRSIVNSIDSSKIGSSIDRLVSEGNIEPIVELISQVFTTADDLTIAEGYVFYHEVITAAVTAKLSDRGFRVFQVDTGVNA